MTIVAVVGASGNVGHPLALELRRRGVAVRALGRSADRLRSLAAAGADLQLGDASDPKFLVQAFRGADAVFAMLPPDLGHPDPLARSRALADALAAAVQVARVRHVVSLSSIGADQPAGNGPIAGLHYLERRLDQVPGLHTTHLRAGYFMENFLGSIGLIRQAGINGSAFRPDLPLPIVATVDVAAAAAELLADPSWRGQRTRELQGPRAYTMAEATRLLGAAIGRPDLGYVAFPPAEVQGALLGAGMSGAMAGLVVEMMEAFNRGHIAPREARGPATTTPTTLEAFAAATFAPAFGA